MECFETSRLRGIWEFNHCVTGVDLEEITEIVERIVENRWSTLVGADPNGIASELRDALMAKGFPEKNIIAIKQGYALRAGYLTLQRKLSQGKLIHADQPLLNWAVANTKQDVQSRLVTKKASGVGKIDPIVSVATAVMALQECAPAVNVSEWIG